RVSRRVLRRTSCAPKRSSRRVRRLLTAARDTLHSRAAAVRFAQRATEAKNSRSSSSESVDITTVLACGEREPCFPGCSCLSFFLLVWFMASTCATAGLTERGGPGGPVLQDRSDPG